PPAMNNQLVQANPAQPRLRRDWCLLANKNVRTHPQEVLVRFRLSGELRIAELAAYPIRLVVFSSHAATSSSSGASIAAITNCAHACGTMALRAASVPPTQRSSPSSKARNAA